MKIMTMMTSCSREPLSNASQPFKSLAKGIIAFKVKTQASSSLSKVVLHCSVYNKRSLNSSSPRIWKDRVEKLPRTPSSNGGAQFFSSGLQDLRRRDNVSLSSRHRGVVSALLPLPGPDSVELVTLSDLQYLSTKLPVPGAGSVELAANIFTLATAIVVPFYTVMILAPTWEWTNKVMRSEIPYFILGAGYIYLLALSWTPETMGLMFSSKYWLPELAGITRMFSSTVTVASAWLHLLAVDLFAGRQVFLDGAKHNIETRHSLVLCLMMCPIGIFSHLITKNLTLFIRRRDESIKEVKRIPPY